MQIHSTGNAQNTSLQRYLLALLLFCFFAAVSTYGQTPDAAALRSGGRAEYWAGHFEKAETLLRRALEAAQRSRDDYTVATVQSDLGTLYHSEERLIEAEQAYKKELSILKRMQGQNYGTAVVLRNLGDVYAFDGRDSEALKVFKEGSKLIKKNLPNERILAAQILNSLAAIYLRQGKMSRAETLLAQAIEIGSAAGGDSGEIPNNLGALYQRQMKYGKAEASYKRSLEIAEQRFGSAHPNITVTLTNLAGLYLETGRYSEAEDRYRRSLTILEQTRPALDGRIVRTLQWLSKTYLKEGEKTLAESALAQAVEIARHNPASDPAMPMLLDTYADVLKSVGKLQQALPLQAEAQRMRISMALTVRVPNPK